jgi:hypothetical protein
MNKSSVGWIFSVLVLLSCFVVLAAGGFLGYKWNEATASLVSAKAELTTANEAISKKNSELEKANKNITSLNGEITDAQDKADQLQASLEAMTAAKTKLETKDSAALCKETAKVDYSSSEGAKDSIFSYARSVGFTVASVDEKIFTVIPGFSNVWVIQMVADRSGTSYTYMNFFLYINRKSTFFGEQGCWVEASQ